MKPKTIIWRIVIEVLIFIMVLTAVDELTWPSKSTAAAVTDAVNRKQLSPVCMVEVNSAAYSGPSTRFPFSVIQLSVLFLLCSDVWALWQSRRKA